LVYFSCIILLSNSLNSSIIFSCSSLVKYSCAGKKCLLSSFSICAGYNFTSSFSLSFMAFNAFLSPFLCSPAATTSAPTVFLAITCSANNSSVVFFNSSLTGLQANPLKKTSSSFP